MVVALFILCGWLGLVGASATIVMVRHSIRHGDYDLLFFPAVMVGLTAIAVAAAVHLITEGM